MAATPLARSVLALASIVGVSALAIQGLARAETSPNRAMHVGSGSHSQYLFAQDAASGSFKMTDRKRGIYRLALAGVRPSALYYSDRPGRIVGAVSVGRMLQGLFKKPGSPHP